MYNQFIPPDGFRPVSPPSGTPPREDHPPKGRSPLSALLSSLLGKGGSGEAYRLTHDGKAVTFTLGESMADVSAILIKP